MQKKILKSLFYKEFLKWTSKMNISDHTKIKNLGSPMTLQESEK